MSDNGAHRIESQHTIIELEKWTLTADLPLKSDGQQLTWRLANFKGRDLMQLWLLHLVANCLQATHSKGIFRGKKEAIDIINMEPVANAKGVLEMLSQTLVRGLTEPLFLNADMLLPMLQDNDDEKAFDLLWDDSFRQRGFRYDPYVAYFWQQQPNYELITAHLRQVHGNLLKCTSIEANVEMSHE